MTSSPIFHLALASDWARAQADGEYRVSTRGMSLEQVGFIHASTADQWPVVRASFYQGLEEPLLLLTLDPDRLTAPLRWDLVPEVGQEFPHLYGPLNLDAVVAVEELPAESASDA